MKIIRVASLTLAFAWLPMQVNAEVLISKGSTWTYLDDNSPQGGIPFRAFPNFDDSGWKTGPAQLGYGDGDEATTVSFGPDPNKKYITTYFRHRFNVANPADYKDLTLNLLRDDGAVVYLNGSEIRRDNLPSSSFSGTLASTGIGGTDEATFFPATIPASALVAGSNLIYAEIHQSAPESSDISFDLELIGNPKVAAAKMVRGPYLQIATPTGIHVRWRTDLPTDSVVRYGTTQSTLDQSASVATASTEHEVSIAGLEPGKRYWYSVGSSAGELAGGDATTFFDTSPAAGTARATRIWVIGDAGNGTADQAAVFNAYRNLAGATPTNVWLMLGDNAYFTGTDAEYQTNMFDVYAPLLKQAPVWPTIGNHDAFSADSATESGPYYDIFTLPRQAEAGGVASGTEAYYSFDYANVHFVVLDSEESARTADGAMMRWLQADLAASNADWLIAYWHRPPYSKGSHDSDTEGPMIEMRQMFLPILEDQGVDLVLTGHSHSYERSKFLNGHYGLSNSFDSSTHVIQAGSGKQDDGGAYRKALGASRAGAVYAVPGSSGWISGGPLNHPAMQASLNELGSMILDVDGKVLNARFLDDKGTVRDYFTIDKSGATANQCSLPWGGTIKDGQIVQAFAQPASVACVSETRTCTNGSLSGSYTYSDCSLPQSGACGLPWGGTIADGGTVTAYQTSTGTACNSETRTCTGGVLSGSFSFQTCAISEPTDLKTLELQNGLNGYAGNVDSHVASRKARGKFGKSKFLMASASQRGSGRAAALLKWDLGQQLPASATVFGAALTLNVFDASASQYQLYAVNQTWDARTVSWRRLNPTAGLGPQIGTLEAGPTGEREVRLNAEGVALVQSWIAGTQTNNGIMLVDSGSKDTIRIRSSEFRTAGFRPKLTLTYR